MHMSLRARSIKKEFLDQEQISTDDLNQNLLELNVINRLLGGYHASRKGLAAIFKSHNSVKSLLDIGFGGGDAILQLSRFTGKYKKQLFFYGVDLKQDCLDYAERNLSSIKNKRLICSDYKNISPDLLEKVDVIHCSLFIHHLENDEIIHLFEMARLHKCILLINDLHRHWLAYHSIKILTALFSKSWLVKNDAALSVKKGFLKKELASLLQEAGYTSYAIKWSWPFRYIVIAQS